VALGGEWRRGVTWRWVGCGAVARVAWRGASGPGGVAWGAVARVAWGGVGRRGIGCDWAGWCGGWSCPVGWGGLGWGRLGSGGVACDGVGLGRVGSGPLGRGYVEQGGVKAVDEIECKALMMAQSWHLSMNWSAGGTAWRGSRCFIAGTPHISSGQGPKTLFGRTPQALASRRALQSYIASHSWCSVHEEHPFLRVSEGLMTEVLAVYGYLEARHAHLTSTRVHL